jgi:hypothetical protein
MDNLKQPSEDEKKGVKMIQHLQKMAGIDEPFDVALAGWRAMSPYEKTQTIAAYKFFRGTRNQ